MKEVKIRLLDASFDGAITMESSQSQFKAVRIDKSHVSVFATDLNHPGIYFLLIGSDTIYVGETGLDSIGKRIVNTHSGSIDSSWHTVVAFLVLMTALLRMSFAILRTPCASMS